MKRLSGCHHRICGWLAHGGAPRAGALLLGCLWTGVLVAAPAKGPVQFNRDIRPIMSDTCWHCHGPDQKAVKGGLRLDLREHALKGGKSGEPAIVPGKPDESEVVRRLFTDNADDLMPPPESHKALTPAQKELFRRWIAEGAKYEAHWAYIPPARPQVPETKDRRWAANPIDAFILAKLEEHKLRPSPEADRRTLLRRLSLDLIGLPPTPEEIAAFLADRSPDACEKQVDRLLRSRQFGERMAVPWLDAVRYADTVGYHGDQNQNIFPYRTYVIDSFNRNKPFDQFTLEQLAGDLLPNPSTEQLIATGFNRLNMMTREGGAQPKEYLAKYAADRVRTIGTAWLGSTLGCCECHNHKFDPFTMRDFYSLAAYFADLRQWGVYSDYKYTPNPDLKGWSNEHPFPPEIRVPSPYLERRKERFERLLNEHLANVAANLEMNPRQQTAFDRWLTEAREFLRHAPDGWLTPAPVAQRVKNGKATNATEIVVSQDGTVQFPKEPGKGETFRLVVKPGVARLAAVRIEATPGDQAEAELSPGAQRQGLRLTLALRPQEGKERKLAVYHADADFKEPRYASTAELIGVKDGWKLSREHVGRRQTSVWLLDPPVTMGADDSLVLDFGGDTIVPLRVSFSPFAAVNPLESASLDLRNALKAGPETNTPDQRSLLAAAWLVSTAADAGAFARYKDLLREVLECRDGKAWTMVAVSTTPMTTRILPRGNWQDESGEIVQPATPAFLPALPLDSERRQTRLDLARWLVSPENPLTSRVVMNRLWKQLFGNGLCNSVEDVGAQGEWPSHPELLDWLAVEFRESGWNFKHMVRLMATSSAYRQVSDLRESALEFDPNNRLLASQNPRRLDAEFVRDNALAIAGLLNLEYGGPSAFPYQPPDYYAQLQFPDRKYVASTDERQYRRGVYMHWQRTFLHPMLANFDAPSREDCTGLRVVSNTPQQALTLLNDPSFVEAARVLAQQLVAETASDAALLDRLYERALARKPSSAERSSLKRLLARQREHYAKEPEEAKKLLRVGQAPAPERVKEAELAAWTSVCRVVLNLHETITRY